MSAELAAVAYCGNAHGHRSCALEAGHTGMHGAPIPGDVRSSWTWWDELELEAELHDTGGPIFKAPPWAKHTFPERKISVKLMGAASRTYPCARIGRAPEGHTPTIHPGETYIRVSLRPDKKGSSAGWRSRPLCRACALDYGLATTTPPPPGKEKAAP